MESSRQEQQFSSCKVVDVFRMSLSWRAMQCEVSQFKDEEWKNEPSKCCLVQAKGCLMTQTGR